uniref:Uncharacterized protein n=1 Tax=Romanomermis culicivorax TaxID=13658 RepID=A0A915K102_ROMCU
MFVRKRRQGYRCREWIGERFDLVPQHTMGLAGTLRDFARCFGWLVFTGLRLLLQLVCLYATSLAGTLQSVGLRNDLCLV